MASKWHRKIAKLAKDLNYDAEEVLSLWAQFALAREYSTKPRGFRSYHEAMAYRDCEFLLDTRGRQPD